MRKGLVLKSIIAAVAFCCGLTALVACKDDGGDSSNSACTHTLTEVRSVLAATCTQTGWQKEVCLDCGVTLQEMPQEKSPHTESEWLVDTAATCANEGIRHTECTVCKTVLDMGALEKTPHTPMKITDVEASCQEAGVWHTECTVCKTVLDMGALEKTPHTQTERRTFVEADCENAGVEHEVCLTCQTTVSTKAVEATGHTFVDEHCQKCGDWYYTGGLAYELNGEGTGYILSGLGEADGGAVVVPPTHNGLPVTAIKSSAFSQCKTLKSIQLPEGITEIPINAFYYCTELTELTLPRSVTTIGPNVFEACTELKTVHIDSIEAWLGITFANHNSCPTRWSGGSLYVDGEAVTRLQVPQGVTKVNDYAFACNGSLTSLLLHDGVTAIGAEAFEGCELTSLHLPKGVTSLAERAFALCPLTEISVAAENPVYKSVEGNLYSKDGSRLLQYAKEKKATAFTIPSGVTEIGEYAFNGALYLQSVDIPEGVTTIGSYAFESCFGLSSLAIPDSVTAIRGYAFYNCFVKTITFGENSGLTVLEDYTFYACTGLRELEIPKSVQSIGNYVFGSCLRLTDIAVAEENPYFTAIDGNLYSKDGTTLIRYAQAKTATSFTLPSAVTAIAATAFADCENLTEIVLHDNLQSIGAKAFYDCVLTELFIPQSVVYIGEQAFQYCEFPVRCAAAEEPQTWHDRWYLTYWGTVEWGCTNNE